MMCFGRMSDISISWLKSLSRRCPILPLVLFDGLLPDGLLSCFLFHFAAINMNILNRKHGDPFGVSNEGSGPGKGNVLPTP
mmetsp:Transcript_51982/g.135738  ORF Transcript_51982/g.135738 Transcript_51982/m.135738 type:complete len:81 (+) Transcript_51982:171-413(+)